VKSVIAQAIADVASNTYVGAVEIADQGADVLLRCARTNDAESTEVFWQEMLQVGWELIRAQPAMAPLVNLINAALWEIERCATVADMRTQLARVAHDFKRRLRVHEAAIAESVLPYLPEGASVLTNSRSTTVRAALLHAQRAGRRFTVLCAEGRPGYEGRTMATELANDGLAVTLMTDAVAIAWAARVQLVLVGADHLSQHGLVNKVGTSSLALTARAGGVPLYTLCSSEKFLPPGYMPPDQDIRAPEQVWSEAPPSILIQNYYFDSTPLTNLSGVITERGMLTPEGVEGWLASIHLHPALSGYHVH
jgi:translation initiation factor 2B subunit (eIF-2B alpha/beta/delta family)